MKWGFTEKQVGHMTYAKWSKLWKSYTKLFDNELYLTLARTYYSEALKQQTIDDIIPF